MRLADGSSNEITRVPFSHTSRCTVVVPLTTTFKLYVTPAWIVVAKVASCVHVNAFLGNRFGPPVVEISAEYKWLRKSDACLHRTTRPESWDPQGKERLSS